MTDKLERFTNWKYIYQKARGNDDDEKEAKDMTNQEEIENIIIKKGEVLYKELEERGRRESSTRDIPLESYVYAYLKQINSLYKYVIDTHIQDTNMGPRLDNLQNNFNIVMKDLWSYYNDKSK